MLNFCTLFDSNFIYLGLAMYESLKRQCGDFHLYVFAFDDNCYKTLNMLKLDKVTVISLAEFENEELLKIKPTRTFVEYFWTCTSSTIYYVLKNFNLDHCTYIDADVYFYSSPEVLFNELESNSVLITEHRYSSKYKKSEILSGKYCVQFITFKNDEKGLKVLNWWKDACIEWCYDKIEYGKFGDQKYLDDWPQRFEGVHVLKHPGGGIASWNIQNYEVQLKNNKLYGTQKGVGDPFEIVFYHFHDIKFNKDKGLYHKIFYIITTEQKKIIYEPYIDHLKSISLQINKLDESVKVINDIRKIKALEPFVVRLFKKVLKKL